MFSPLIALLAFLTSPVPPLPPVHLICNTRGSICAIVEPELGLTTVVRREGTGSTALWVTRRPGAIFVSEDGTYLVFGSREGVAPKRFHSGDAYVTFVSQFRTTSVALKDLFPNTWDAATKSERQDASHFVEYNQEYYKWGDLLGFDRHGFFRIRLIKDGVVLIDPVTGNVKRSGA